MEISKINTAILYKVYKNKVNNPLNYNDFKTIISKFNKDIIEQILIGYNFNVSPLGIFMVLLNYRLKNSEKYPDWNKSNNLKKSIIERGGIPYREWYEKDGKVIDQDKFGNPLQKDAVLKNNGGEKWLVFFTDEYYFKWNWYKNKQTKYIRNITKYKFIPTKGNKRLLSSIKNKIENPELIFTLKKNVNSK